MTPSGVDFAVLLYMSLQQSESKEVYMRTCVMQDPALVNYAALHNTSTMCMCLRQAQACSNVEGACQGTMAMCESRLHKISEMPTARGAAKLSQLNGGKLASHAMQRLTCHQFEFRCKLQWHNNLSDTSVHIIC